MMTEAKRPMTDVLRRAEAYAAAHQFDPVGQRLWAETRPPEERAYFRAAMESMPRVQLEGIDEITMEMAAEELPALSWELRDLIRMARPIWDQQAR